MGGSILGEILAAKRRRLAAGEFTPAARAGAPPDGARFAASLRPSSPSKKSLSLSPTPAFLAELKRRSPSAGVLAPDLDARLESIACAYRRGGAAALSVVVEQDFFDGDPAWIARAKGASGLPVLMKDFVVDERQLDFACALGADAVLLIVAALSDGELAGLHAAATARGLAVLVEAHDETEGRRAAAVGAGIVGVNARDLATFKVDVDAMARLGALLPQGAVRVAESGIKSRRDVEALSASGYDACLVGEALVRSDDPARALRELRGANPTEVKVCGITRAEDVDACLANGVDWIGLIFAERSPRRVTAEEGRFLRVKAMGGGDARREHGGAAGGVKGVVAVFDEGASENDVRAVTSVVEPDAVQMPLLPSKKIFSSDLPLWNTIRVGRDDLAAVGERAGDALHFDTSVGGVSGGTGVTFDWSVLSGAPRTRPIVLAGGLTPANVADAIRRAAPDVVDVSSGVESAPGIKDAKKIAAFVSEVRRA